MSKTKLKSAVERTANRRFAGASGYAAALRAEKVRCERLSRQCEKDGLTGAMHAWRFRATGVGFALKELKRHTKHISNP